MNGRTTATALGGGHTADPAVPWRRAAVRGESRWPTVIAVVAASGLQMALPGWLSLAISFAASDVIPLTRWAKMMMMLQSAVSVAAIALVVARAVSIFH